MSDYVLSIKSGVSKQWGHDPSAVLFKNGKVIFAAEEERFTRRKHANNTFPKQAIEASLNYENIGLCNIQNVAIPCIPENIDRIEYIKQSAKFDIPLYRKLYRGFKRGLHITELRQSYIRNIKEELAKLPYEGELPSISKYSHHRAHAATAFYPANFDNGLVLTIDGRGEYESTVVWEASDGNLERLREYTYPNSLGLFYGVITKFLGFRFNNGEGKVMGLAPYGTKNKQISSRLRSVIQTGYDYDVTEIAQRGGVSRLESILEMSSKDDSSSFTQKYKDLAFTAQQILEEIVTNLTDHYLRETGHRNLALAGGVCLNCKMNQKLMELGLVDNIFIQPVSTDAGLPIGAAMLEQAATDFEMSNVYWGQDFSDNEVEEQLDKSKLDYFEYEEPEKYIAEQIADGKLVGWYQGRSEMGPRALGNRSILADPRSDSSRDRVNNHVKSREDWRPFAPSLLEVYADDYLRNAQKSPYMIKTFDTNPKNREDMAAVIHPSDDTTRPQTVTREANPPYFRLISEFKEITGVPIILNTSFNDHGEPIVNTPKECIKDFFAMGLDILYMDGRIVEK